ncbi:universal stress protein [Dokdonella sp.]|uniref:universal stress protein n=1 Tax=Dokdonella sp. TaxID=2291710 RepID=UPI003527E3A2
MSATETTLIHADGCVLAALDVSSYSASVAEMAAWAAARLGAPLEFVHAIDRSTAAPGKQNLSGNLALGDREDLLAELTALDESRSRVAQESGRRLLSQALALAAQSHGIKAESRLRHGALVDTLLEFESEVRLFVIGKRGEHADFAKGHLGSNLERVVRAVHRPVLVAARSFSAPQRFLIAFDNSATTRRCIEMVCASPLLRDLPCNLLMVGESSSEPEGLEWAREQLSDAGFHVDVHVVSGPADAAIAKHVQEQPIDLIVMGAYGHSRIRSMILGSTTTEVLRSCLVPVLLLR